MRCYILTLTWVLAFGSCYAQRQNFQHNADTILNICNPSTLDLNKHQLFIDTSRQSPFYQAIADWGPHKFDHQSIDYYLKEIKTKQPLVKVDLKNFPRLWVSLRQLDDELVLYDRCDGIDQRFALTDSSFAIYGPLESDADAIQELVTLTDDELVLQLRTIQQKSKSQTVRLSIKRTQYKHVYLMTYQTGTNRTHRLVTPTSAITQFDLVVNHCPKMKRMEYVGFRKIDFESFK